MKISTLTSLHALAGLVGASPTATWQATVTDKANLGFATQNGGTTGGSGGTVTTVSTLAQFTAAVSEKNSTPAVVFIQGVISGNAKVRIGSNKSILGLPGAGFEGIGLQFKRQKNLIIRNIRSSSVVAANGDALTIDNSTNVWIDHCEFHSVKGTDKDYYDGLVDVTHGADFVTISHTFFHDHWKTSLVGHSDSNAAQDRGRLRVTYAHNHWRNVGSRAPSVRFGTAHVYNSLYQNVSSAVNTRMGARVVVESNVFRSVKDPITSADSKEPGTAVANDNDLSGASNKAPAGSFSAATVIPYAYTLLGSGAVASRVPGEAGAILTFAPITGNATRPVPLVRRARTVRLR